jgi:hypothetical protein
MNTNTNRDAAPVLGESEPAKFDGARVREDELDEIQVRRQQSQQPKQDHEQIRQNLVGLALSGGGQRSGAFSLGVLQALYQRGVLRFIDYLSTVSGGGYAGAYLSSVALKGGAPRTDRGAADSSRAALNGEEPDALFPIAVGADGRQSRRMLDFIHGGAYLRRTWVFFNRYLIGLVLIWITVLSGFFAVTSGTALLFRQLDGQRMRNFAGTLGFDDDVKLALFPSFVIFVFWLITWVISYFKFGPRATGNVARYLFYLLITTVLVAVAALIGNGDIALKSLISDSSGSVSSTLQRGFQMTIISAIIGALLPYLSPGRLFRSGTAPKNAVEKYTFWVSTRALAYGVPFVLVAYFARENISKWNDRRDDRLRLTEVKDWGNGAARLWQEITDENAQLVGRLWSRAVDSWSMQWLADNAQIDELDQLKTELEPGSNSGLTMYRDMRRRYLDSQSATNAANAFATQLLVTQQLMLAVPATQVLATPMFVTQPIAAQALATQEVAAREFATRQLDRLRVLFERLRRLELDAKVIDMRRLAGSTTEAGSEAGEAAEQNALWDEKYRLSFAERWQFFFEFLGEMLFRLDVPTDHPFYRNFKLREQVRGAREELVEALNDRLRRPDLYATLVPKRVFGETTGATISKEATRAPNSKEPTVASNPELEREFIRVQNPNVAVDKELEKQRAAWRGKIVALRAEAVATEDRSKPPWKLEPPGARAAAVAKLVRPAQTVVADEGTAAEQLPRAELQVEAQNRVILSMNRKLLQSYFANAIGDRTTVYSYTVLAEDQKSRTKWFLWSLAIFVLSGLLVDLNATSLHGFYSTMIGNMWIQEVPGLGRKIPLAQLETTDVGRPYHLISCAVQLMGKFKCGGYIAQDLFLFSKLYCGSDRLAYAKTSEYMEGRYKFDDAIAVSGAAVTPALSRNPLLVALLTLANVRLGQWISNPAWKPSAGWIRRMHDWWPVTPFRVLFGIFRVADYRPVCFVTDGGHHENLGIEALLQRRCRLIIASDAGQDCDYDFADLTKLIRWARIRYGIVLQPIDHDGTIDLTPLIPASMRKRTATSDDASRPGATDASAADRLWSPQHYQILRIEYPKEGGVGPSTGYIIYMKSTMTGDEPLDVMQFKKANALFPHDPTADQFFDPARFESYRYLGYHIADDMCERLRFQPSGSDKQLTVEAFVMQMMTQPAAATQNGHGDREKAGRGVPTNGKSPTPPVGGSEEMETRFFDDIPQLLRLWQHEQKADGNAWLQKSILQFLLDNAGHSLPHLQSIVDRESDAKVRASAAWFLREFAVGNYQLDRAQLRKVLLATSADRDAKVRSQVIQALGAFDRSDPECRSALERARKDASKTIRDLATEILNRKR